MRKRSKYRPKGIIQDPIRYVIAGLKAPNQNAIEKVQIVNHGSLYSLTHGTGTRMDWDNITAALNVSLVLCEKGLGTEYKDDILNGMRAHNNCGIRHVKGKNFGYTGPELQAVSIALEVHDAQLPLVTVIEFERAHDEVVRRIAKGKIEFNPTKDEICTSC